MHEIIFYQDRNGRQPVLDYMEKLGKSKSKDSRIKLNKISDYIQALRRVRNGAADRKTM